MIKLDKKDRKLLYYLSTDCRLSNTQLSKKIGLSKNAVQYRIDRLRKEGVITKFACVVNLGTLNYFTITLLLKFNEDIYEKKEIIEYFRNHGLADWVVSLSGQYDLFVELVVKDLTHLDKTINEITTRFNSTLSNYKMFFSMPVRVEHLMHELYSDLNLKEPEIKERKLQSIILDEKDRKILAALNEDSSMPYLAIAKKLGMSIDIIRYRIKNMVKNGVILKFFSEVSLKKLGYTQYLYRMSLKNISTEKMEKLKSRLKTNNNITYAFYDIAGFNIIFVCAFKDAEGIDHLSRSMRKDFSDIIEEQEYLIIKEQILFNLFPKGVSELK